LDEIIQKVDNINDRLEDVENHAVETFQLEEIQEHVINLEEGAVEKTELDGINARLDNLEAESHDTREMEEIHEDIAHLITDVRALQNTISIEVE
jgi:hypothetical protein